MKKWMFIVILFGLLPGMGLTQDILHLQAGVGPAIPLGRIASNDDKDSSAGYASTGGMLEFRLSIKPFKYVGFAFNGGLGLMLLNIGSIKNRVFNQSGLDINGITGNHLYGYASGGLIFGHRVKEKWMIDGTVTGGYIWSQMPDIEFSQNGTIYYKSYKSDGGGWMVSAQVSFRYLVYKTFFIGAGLEYMYARPRFTNLIVEERISNQSSTRQSIFAQNMSVIYFSANLGLTF